MRVLVDRWLVDPPRLLPKLSASQEEGFHDPRKRGQPIFWSRVRGKSALVEDMGDEIVQIWIRQIRGF